MASKRSGAASISRQAAAARIRFDDGVTFLGQVFGQRLATNRFIIDNQRIHVCAKADPPLIFLPAWPAFHGEKISAFPAIETCTNVQF